MGSAETPAVDRRAKALRRPEDDPGARPATGTAPRHHGRQAETRKQLGTARGTVSHALTARLRAGAETDSGVRKHAGPPKATERGRDFSRGPCRTHVRRGRPVLAADRG